MRAESPVISIAQGNALGRNCKNDTPCKGRSKGKSTNKLPLLRPLQGKVTTIFDNQDFLEDSLVMKTCCTTTYFALSPISISFPQERSTIIAQLTVPSGKILPISAHLSPIIATFVTLEPP